MGDEEVRLLESNNFAYMPNHALDSVIEAETRAITKTPAVPTLSELLVKLEEEDAVTEVFKPMFDKSAEEPAPEPRRSSRKKKTTGKKKKQATAGPVRRSARLRKKRGE